MYGDRLQACMNQCIFKPEDDMLGFISDQSPVAPSDVCSAGSCLNSVPLSVVITLSKSICK